MHVLLGVWDNITDRKGGISSFVMQARQKIILIVSSLLLLVLVTGILCSATVFLTTPRYLGPAGVTFWFIGAFLFLSGALSLLGFAWKMRKLKNREKLQWSLNESLRTGFLLGFVVVILLALASLKSLTLRDIILFVLTVVIVEFYFRTRRVNEKGKK